MALYCTGRINLRATHGASSIGAWILACIGLKHITGRRGFNDIREIR